MNELISKLFSPGTALLVLIIIGIFTALYTAVIQFFFGRKLKRFESDLTAENQLLIQNLQADNARALKTLEAELTKNTQTDLQQSQARQDYEYEARKRLYQECEPLIFQFMELSENALHRIYSLARSTRQGNLPRWLAENEYYIASTMYNLLAPVVVYKLIQRRLTIVDLKLDGNIDRHYQLAKHLAWTFTADFDFAWGLNVFPLPYDPNNAEWEKLRDIEPAKYWRQGLPIGRFDNAVESLIIRDPEPDGPQRLMSFGEFEVEFHQSSSRIRETFFIIRDMFTSFQPVDRPVLWRMLITQAHIYEAIGRFHSGNKNTTALSVTPILESDRKPFYWRKDPTYRDLQQFAEPFDVAEAYLQKWLGEIFQNREPSAE